MTDPKVLVIGRRGFIASHLIATLKNAVYISSSESYDFEGHVSIDAVIVLSAPTRNSKDFTLAFEQHKNIQEILRKATVFKPTIPVLLIGSIGVCEYRRQNLNLIFKPKVKQLSRCLDDYQFWKKKQIDDNKNLNITIIHLPIVMAGFRDAIRYQLTQRLFRRIEFCHVKDFVKYAEAWIDKCNTLNHTETTTQFLRSGTCLGLSPLIIGKPALREIAKFLLQHRSWHLMIAALEFHLFSQKLQNN
jgi:nucleoside-diphosphate-sugar epimerase